MLFYTAQEKKAGSKLASARPRQSTGEDSHPCCCIRGGLRLPPLRERTLHHSRENGNPGIGEGMLTQEDAAPLWESIVFAGNV